MHQQAAVDSYALQPILADDGCALSLGVIPVFWADVGIDVSGSAMHVDLNFTCFPLTQGGAIVALKPGNFGRDPIALDQARAVHEAIVAGRRPPLKRAQVALTSYVLHYARRWAK